MNKLLLTLTLSCAICVTASCAIDPPRQEVVSGIAKVDPIRIPVPIPCASLNEIPDIPATNMRPDVELSDDKLAAMKQLTLQLRADIDDWKDYGARADPLLRGCMKETQPTDKGTKP